MPERGDREESSRSCPAVFEGTVDWDAYWRNREAREGDEHPASVGEGKFEHVSRLFDHVGVPEDAAFVGCGPAVLPVAVAQTYPDIRVVGYDAAASVIAANREQYADVPNVSFETAVLPEFDVDRQFDLVYTYATLHYVREVETAIRAMYRRVRPGGCLVCHYPNRETPEEYRDVEGKLRKRFRLVCEGENLTSRERIADLLDANVRDFWEVTDADGPYVRSSNPCVVVEK